MILIKELPMRAYLVKELPMMAYLMAWPAYLDLLGLYLDSLIILIYRPSALFLVIDLNIL